MREELYPAGLEVVDVCLEMGGAEIARQYVDEAASTHPSLIDEAHVMDARFGVTNIPQVIWIDESGTDRPSAGAGDTAPGGRDRRGHGRDDRGRRAREKYVERLRDWVANGAASRYALAPDEVVARSRPRSSAESEAAAHFELAQHIWRREGLSERALAHFNAAHELQPDNITYKRQAYSVVGVERSEDTEWGRFRQAPEEGEDWPFISDFNQDLSHARSGVGQAAGHDVAGGTRPAASYSRRMAGPVVMTASRSYTLAAPAAYERTLSVPLEDLFPRRFGPIPAVTTTERTSADPWGSLGQVRTVRLADGGSFREELTRVEPPAAFGYALSEVTGPMRFLVSGVDGLWRFDALPAAARITWTWEVRPATAAARLLLPVFAAIWRQYAKRSLDRLEHFLLAG